MSRCLTTSFVSLLLLAVGCQGLTPGRMEAVRVDSDKPRAGNVYLVRGLIGVFSTGIDELADKLDQAGVRANVFQDNQHSHLANAIIKQYRGVKNHEPIVLIGHSYGADGVLRISQALAEHNIPVQMVVTIDATVPPPVAPNVEVCYNYFQSQPTDVIPMFRGIPLKPEKPGTVKIVNMDLRKDRTDLLVDGTNHINIDKNPRVHDVIVRQVMEVCPPRAVWAARHAAPTPGEPVRASAVIGASEPKSRGAR